MAFRLKLVPDNTKIDFFGIQWLTAGASIILMVLSVVVTMTFGLNFGIDFQGGTSIRAESSNDFNIADYRQAMAPLGFEDVSITEVYDPTFGPDRHVALIRVSVDDESGSVTPERLNEVLAALHTVDTEVRFTAVESVGPKVSGELIRTAIQAVIAATFGILLYIWMRFEWQFALGAVIALVHDVLLTVGIFSLFQIKFDLTTIAALLTILGYSVNDTVVVFDRLRENLIKFKTMPLRDIMNLTVNETLSRTVMTCLTTVIALTALIVLGGDVIRSFVFAMLWGVIVGTYSTVYLAKNVVLWLGVKRDWDKTTKNDNSPYADMP